MSAEFLRKYNTATHIYIPIIKRGVVDFAVGADWTPAAGDVKISKDGGAAANIGTLPVAIVMGNTAMWDFVFTGTEVSAAKVSVTVSDSATKAVEDTMFDLITYGNASAELLPDLKDAVRLGLTALPNAAAEAAGGLYTRGSGAGQINQPANGQIDVNTVKVSGTAQTARDLGASVLLSPGTGTGQLSLISGAVLLQATQTGVTIPTVTTLTNAPSDSSGVTTLLAKFVGITLLAQWLGALAGKQSANATAQTEIRATGAGSGTFDATTDAQEAIRDNMGTAQTGDNYARLGAPAGASVSADIAAVQTTASAVPNANANADALLDRASAVDTYTPRGIFRLIGASLLGQLAGAATTTVTAKAADASKTRITATVDASGNRTSVTLDAT